jgi:hypothetical protein
MKGFSENLDGSQDDTAINMLELRDNTLAYVLAFLRIGRHVSG